MGPKVLKRMVFGVGKNERDHQTKRRVFTIHKIHKIHKTCINKLSPALYGGISESTIIIIMSKQSTSSLHIHIHQHAIQQLQ